MKASKKAGEAGQDGAATHSFASGATGESQWKRTGIRRRVKTVEALAAAEAAGADPPREAESSEDESDDDDAGPRPKALEPSFEAARNICLVEVS